MKLNKRIPFLFALALLLFTQIGCFMNVRVEPGTVVAIRNGGSEVTSIETGGKHTRLGLFATHNVVNVSAQTVVWSDPDLITKDPQPIGYTVSIIYRRSPLEEDVTKMLSEYNAAALSDEALAALVLSQVPDALKAVTAEFKLNEQLGVPTADSAEGVLGREVVVNRINTLLKPELSAFYVDLIDVGINNIAPSAEYVTLLEELANSRQAAANAAQLQQQYEEELKAEEALTAIEVERANRTNLVNQELAKTYDVSERAFELERLRLLAEIFGEQDKIFFVPQGADLSMFFSPENFGTLTPIEGE